MKRKLSAFLFVIVLILFAGIFVYSYLQSFNSPSIIGEGGVKLKTERESDLVNILVAGEDSGDPNDKLENSPKRTDSIMIVNYNSKTESINIVSVPRDTLININGKKAKINSANFIGGEALLRESIEELLNINVDYFAKVNYEGFRRIIDLLGGVEVEIKNRMDYDDPSQNLHIHFKKGEKVLLDGKKAEEYFRWRKNNDGTGLLEGDIGRIENQQELIKKAIEKFKNPETAVVIPEIFAQLPKFIKTNMTPKDIIKYGYKFIKVNYIKFNVLKGESKYINGVSYFIFKEEENTQILQIIKEITFKEIGGNKFFSLLMIKYSYNEQKP